MDTHVVFELLERYRAAFEGGNVGGVLDCCRCPLQVVSVDAGDPSISIAGEADWALNVRRLLDTYRRLGLSDAVMADISVSPLLDAMATAQVRWALHSSSGELIYDFTAVYTVVESDVGPRIIAVAHDEMPKLRAALAGR